MPASGYDWVAFGISESAAIDIALQVDFSLFKLRPKGTNTTSSILLVRSNSFHGTISGCKLFGQRI